MSTFFLDPLFERGDQSYLLHGDPSLMYQKLSNDSRASSYVVLPYIYGTLTIDNARSIKTEASLREADDAPRLLYIGADEISRDAEQSLLKLLEEPPVNTRILLVTQQIKLLPTVLSRVVDLGRVQKDASTPGMLAMSIADRLAYIQKLTKDSEDTEVSRREIKRELTLLIAHFREQLHKTSDLQALKKLRDLEDTAIAIETKGAPVKMLLEHLAMTL